MEDPLDQLSVPDDWIEIINSQKRSCDESQDEVSPAKLPRLSVGEQNNGTQESSSQNDSKDEKLKEIKASEGDVLNGNSLSVPLIKNDSVSSSQETIPILSTRTLEDDRTSDVKSDNLSTPPTSEANEVVAISPSKKTSEPGKEIQKIPSVMHDTKNLMCVFPGIEEQKIYDMLVKERTEESRLDVVSTKLLELEKTNLQENGAKTTVSSSDGERSIFMDVEIVMKEIPSADANKVYTMLESIPPALDRAQNVICLIKKDMHGHEKGKSSGEQNPALLKKESTFIDDTLRNDPIFCDMRFIAKMFPDKDRNEIYALLEANITNPNRVDMVVNEFLTANRLEAKPSGDNGGQQKSAAVDSELGSSEGATLQDDVERLRCFFPDIDPNYLYQRFEMLKDKPERCHILAGELFETRNYPKFQDIPQEQPTKRDFTVEEFLEKFPDPQKTFGNEEQEVKSYQEHAFVVLKNDFRMLKSGYIRQVLTKHRYHLLPSYEEINADLVAIPLKNRKSHGRFLRNLRTRCNPPPTEPNEFFYHELWYTRNEQKVKDYTTQKEIDRTLKFTEAKEKGELYECCCCYDNECLFEDLTSCPEGHLFCKVCVVRSTEAAFGEMKSKFPCLTGDCDQHLPLSTLQSIIPANLFSKILSRIQEEEVQQANIPDLVTCPFCPFATIMPNQDDKVLKCLNPDCLKESCRLCLEDSHIPLKCSEVESKATRSMRTFIENYIAEAVIRKCHLCGKKFVKESGCNKMTCVCGATSCYACKAEDIDYDHFNQAAWKNICNDTDPTTIHQRDMEQAAIKGRNKYLEDHPETVDIECDSDFNKWFKSLANNASMNPEEEESDAEPVSSYGDEEDDEEDEEDDYY